MYVQEQKILNHLVSKPYKSNKDSFFQRLFSLSRNLDIEELGRIQIYAEEMYLFKKSYYALNELMN